MANAAMKAELLRCVPCICLATSVAQVHEPAIRRARVRLENWLLAVRAVALEIVQPFRAVNNHTCTVLPRQFIRHPPELRAHLQLLMSRAN